MSDYTIHEPVEITAITEDNFRFFSVFLPLPVQERLRSDPMAMAMGAVIDGTACAALAFAVDEPVVQLLSIAVAPDYQRQYIGTTLFCEMVDFFEVAGEFAVQTVQVEYADNGGGVRAFLDSLMFAQEELAGKTISAPLHRLKTHRMVQGNGSPPAGCAYIALDELSPYHLGQLNDELDAHGANFTGLPVSADTVDPRISFVCYQQERPVGCICFSGDVLGVVTLSVFFTAKQSPDFVLGLMRRAVQLLSCWGGEDTVIQIPLVQPSAFRLADTLVGDLGSVCESLVRAEFLLDIPMAEAS